VTSIGVSGDIRQSRRDTHRCGSLCFTLVNHVVGSDGTDDLHQFVLLFSVGEVTITAIRGQTLVSLEKSCEDSPSVI
jgi:hypothetical protein